MTVCDLVLIWSKAIFMRVSIPFSFRSVSSGGERDRIDGPELMVDRRDRGRKVHY